MAIYFSELAGCGMVTLRAAERRLVPDGISDLLECSPLNKQLLMKSQALHLPRKTGAAHTNFHLTPFWTNGRWTLVGLGRAVGGAFGSDVCA
jgi:hypothetical protein